MRLPCGGVSFVRFPAQTMAFARFQGRKAPGDASVTRR